MRPGTPMARESNSNGFYDTFAPFYPVFDLFLGAPKKIMVRRINKEKPGRLLEIGVGRGDTLAAYTHPELTGIDISQGMLAFARKRKLANCSLHVMDAGAMEFTDASFEYAVLAYVLSVIPDPAKALSEVHRVLSPGGRAFILNHDPSGPLRQKMNRLVAPLVSKCLRFSAVFDVQTVIDPAKFSIIERKRCAIIPHITLFVLERL